MDRLREEAKRLLMTSGYKGMQFLHFYLKPFKEAAKQEGFTCDQVEDVINIIVDEFFTERNWP